MRYEKYTMDLVCAVEHLERVINERVTLEEREHVINCVIRRMQEMKVQNAPRIEFYMIKEVGKV